MSLSADMLLAHLQKVRQTRQGEWTACCPAHRDKSPSLAIKDCGDGRILLHCFAGCSVEEILESMAMTFADIMPERAPEQHRLPGVPFHPLTVLRAMAFSSTIVGILASDMAKGKPISVEDKDALWEIVGEFQEAVSHATR